MFGRALLSYSKAKTIIGDLIYETTSLTDTWSYFNPIYIVKKVVVALSS